MFNIRPFFISLTEKKQCVMPDLYSTAPEAQAQQNIKHYTF